VEGKAKKKGKSKKLTFAEMEEIKAGYSMKPGNYNITVKCI
jgi:hypothetical protein